MGRKREKQFFRAKKKTRFYSVVGSASAFVPLGGDPDVVEAKAKPKARRIGAEGLR